MVNSMNTETRVSHLMGPNRNIDKSSQSALRRICFTYGVSLGMILTPRKLKLKDVLHETPTYSRRFCGILQILAEI
jgi:hypothetical protein